MDSAQGIAKWNEFFYKDNKGICRIDSKVLNAIYCLPLDGKDQLVLVWQIKNNFLALHKFFKIKSEDFSEQETFCINVTHTHLVYKWFPFCQIPYTYLKNCINNWPVLKYFNTQYLLRVRVTNSCISRSLQMKKLSKTIFNFDNIILMEFIRHKNLKKIAYAVFFTIFRTTRVPLTFTLTVTPFLFSGLFDDLSQGKFLKLLQLLITSYFGFQFVNYLFLFCKFSRQLLFNQFCNRNSVVCVLK